MTSSDGCAESRPLPLSRSAPSIFESQSQIRSRCCARSLELRSQQRERICDWLSYIDGADLLRGSGRDSAQPSDEVIYSRDLPNDYLREVLSKVAVRKALRE